jgi:hypothetical protein
MSVTSGSLVTSGSSGASEVTRRAQSFEEWLGEADTDEDAFVRRLLLLTVCDKAPESTPQDRIRSFVKDLHRHIHR